MVGIAPVEIPTEGDRDIRMAGVVGGVHHELAQGSEVALDAIQIAGGSWRRNQLDVVRLGPGADLRCPVQRQIVVDQIDAQVIGIAPSNALVEREHLVGGLGQTITTEQHVAVDVVSTEEVADSTSAHIGSSSPPRPLALSVTMARVGLERNWPELIEAHHHPISRARAVQRHHAGGLLLEQGIGAALPGAGALEGDVFLAQDAAQRLDGNAAYQPTTLQVAFQPPQRPAGQRLAQGRRRRSAMATIRSRVAGSNFLGRPVPTFGFRLSNPKSLNACMTRRTCASSVLQISAIWYTGVYTIDAIRICARWRSACRRDFLRCARNSISPCSSGRTNNDGRATDQPLWPSYLPIPSPHRKSSFRSIVPGHPTSRRGTGCPLP